MLADDFEFLIGDKVIIKKFDESFITNEYVGWLNDPTVMMFSNQRFIEHTLSSCKHYLSSFKGTNNLFLAIVSKDTGKLLGSVNSYISLHHGLADIGIMIGNKSQWGKGTGLDAWLTLMDYLFAKCHIRKITGGTPQANVAMVKIMEKSGMTLEATRPKHHIIDGEPQDILYFAKYNQNELNLY